MPTRLENLQVRLDQYLQLEQKILENGQEYEISQNVDGSRMKRASLADVQRMIQQLENQIATETARSGNGGSRIRYGVPTY